MAVVFVPSLMRALTGGEEKVSVPGSNLRQVIESLDEQYPGFKGRLLNDEGQIEEGLAVAINGETTHMGLIEPVDDATEIHFIPAIGGGSAVPTAS